MICAHPCETTATVALWGALLVALLRSGGDSSLRMDSTEESAAALRQSVIPAQGGIVADGRVSEDPHWLEEATRLLDWEVKPRVSFAGDFKNGDVSWYADGRLSVTHNCVFRHDAGRTALLWDADDPRLQPLTKVSYGALGADILRLAAYLSSAGVAPGAAVTVYMPMVPAAVVSMLACAHVGAAHSVVFAGFSAAALAERIADARSSVVVTADEGLRGGRRIPLKAVVDAAIGALGPDSPVRRVVVFRRTGASVPFVDGRDISWDDALSAGEKWRLDNKLPPADSAEAYNSASNHSSFGAEEPLFVLYTSGSTGRPKGLVHSRGGYLHYALRTLLRTFAPRDDAVIGCVADVGWITGHSYAVYGPLAAGLTTLLFEGTPLFPDAGRYWDTAVRARATHLYVAPTAVRALRRLGDAHVVKYRDEYLATLRVIGTVGEPISADAWLWLWDVVGGRRCALVDTYWQTETGGHVAAPAAAGEAVVPGAAGRPCPGIALAVLDPRTGSVLSRAGRPSRDIAIGRLGGATDSSPTIGESDTAQGDPTSGEPDTAPAVGESGAAQCSHLHGESGAAQSDTAQCPQTAGESSLSYADYESGEGVLAISQPWPGMARTILGDHARYFQTYFAPFPGHFCTGDRAHVDANGRVWIRGRADDVINVSGHRLGTAEVEAALARHACVAEAAVLGRPDAITGEAVVAFVVLRDGSVGKSDAISAELVAVVRATIGPFAAPRRVFLVRDLPKTRSGKIMRRLLRRVLAGATDGADLGDTSTLLDPAVVAEIVALVRASAD